MGDSQRLLPWPQYQVLLGGELGVWLEFEMEVLGDPGSEAKTRLTKTRAHQPQSQKIAELREKFKNTSNK